MANGNAKLMQECFPKHPLAWDQRSNEITQRNRRRRYAERRDVERSKAGTKEKEVSTD